MTPFARIARPGRFARLAWIQALVVVQLAALLAPPARAQPGAGFIEVCTAAGVKRVPSEPQRDRRHACEHCPLCRVAAGAAMPPAFAAAAMPSAPLAHVVPAGRTNATHAAPPYHAPARAPPT